MEFKTNPKFMSKELEQKIRDVEDEHFGEIERSRIEQFDLDHVCRAHEIRGALRAVGTISEMLMSQHVRGLMLIEEQKLWKVFREKYSSFADFLNRAEEVQGSKSLYYQRRDVLLAAGDEVLDAIHGKISPRKVQKLLADGVPMLVEDGQLKIGDESIAIADARGMARVIEGWHLTLVERDERDSKKDAKIEKLENRLDQGQRDFDELQRSLDATREGNPHDRSLGRIVECLLEHTEVVGQMDDKTKAKKGADALETLWSVLLQVRRSYGIGFHFNEQQATAADGVVLSPAMEAAINEPDDLDLEPEE